MRLNAGPVSCIGWDLLSIIDDSFATILLSPTTCTVFKGHPRTALPVQFIVQVYTQVLIRVHSLNVLSLDVHRCCRGVTAPAEVHHQLLGFPRVDLEAVSLAPVHKVLSQFSELPVIIICDEAYDGRVVRELLQMAGGCAAHEVCSVQGEQKGSQDCSLWRSSAADYCIRNTVPCPHILGAVGEVVDYPGCEVMIHS